MIAFEKYLIENGWNVTHTERLKKVEGYKEISSLGNITNDYTKDNRIIRVGLGEIAYSPYVIEPVIWNMITEDNIIKHTMLGARDMHKMQNNLSNEELLSELLKWL